MGNPSSSLLACSPTRRRARPKTSGAHSITHHYRANVAQEEIRIGQIGAASPAAVFDLATAITWVRREPARIAGCGSERL
jgi:hypothetical protein